MLLHANQEKLGTLSVRRKGMYSFSRTLPVMARSSVTDNTSSMLAPYLPGLQTGKPVGYAAHVHEKSPNISLQPSRSGSTS